MFTNAVLGGVLVATYLVVLVLQLNPHVEVVSMTAVWWFVSLLAFYGPYLSVLLYFMLLIRDALSARPLSPAWVSVRLLAWMGAAGAALAAALTWANLRGFRAVLSDAAAERMHHGATATTIVAGLLVAVAVLRYSFGRRGSRTTGAVLVGLMLLSVLVPLYLRGPVELPVPAAQRPVLMRTVPEPPRVRLLLLDGASIGFIRQRVAAGQLPNLGNLLDRGAFMHLATLKPTQAEVVWTAAATGKYPPKTGIRSNARYHVTSGETAPVNLLPDYCFAYALVLQGFVLEDTGALTSNAIDARPFWDIAADYGLRAGIVGWPLTYPAHATRGYVLSDRFDEATSSPLRDPDAGAPTTTVDIAREVFDRWLAVPWSDVLPPATPPVAGAADDPPDDWVVAKWDHAYSEAAAALELQLNPRVTAVRYEALDAFGHRYLQDAQPERFGELRRETHERSILDQYYSFIDAEVGRATSRLRPGDLLLVMSGHGMEPTPLSKRLLARLLGNDDPAGTHEPAPDGFLLALGTNVAHGELRRGAIVDLAPTVLYYLGLAVGRDMDGFARTDLFLRSFTERPVTYIATHEGVILESEDEIAPAATSSTPPAAGSRDR
jgi:hypothetical protein